jgi:hypothetical protein
MNIDGRCHCGYITFEADADPDKAWICHCTDCQSFSGSAFRTIARVQGWHVPAPLRGTYCLREDCG